jgi:hypothetical protein
LLKQADRDSFMASRGGVSRSTTSGAANHRAVMSSTHSTEKATLPSTTPLTSPRPRPARASMM